MSGARTRHGEPSSSPCARQAATLSPTHDNRSRKLPTNHYHASLPGPIAQVTREYQSDSPSTLTSLLTPELSRDGPGGKEALQSYTRRDLTGSFISGDAFKMSS